MAKPSIPASNRKVAADDNAPPTMTFHDEIVALGQGIRDGMVAVETGKKASMERFMLAATAGELDPTNDGEFERNWMDWRFGESRANVKRSPGENSEMSRFKNFCIAALKMNSRGVDFRNTIAAVQDTFNAIKAERAANKKLPAPIQIERALSKVATLAKDHNPTDAEIRNIVRGTPVLPDEVKKAKAAADEKAKAAAIDPKQAAIDNLLAQIDALLKVGVPNDWKPVLRKVHMEVAVLGDSLSEEEEEEERETEDA